MQLVCLHHLENLPCGLGDIPVVFRCGSWEEIMRSYVGGLMVNQSISVAWLLHLSTHTHTGRYTGTDRQAAWPQDEAPLLQQQQQQWCRQQPTCAFSFPAVTYLRNTYTFPLVSNPSSHSLSPANIPGVNLQLADCSTQSLFSVIMNQQPTGFCPKAVSTR